MYKWGKPESKLRLRKAVQGKGGLSQILEDGVMTDGLSMNSRRRGKGRESDNKRAVRYRSVLEAGQSHCRTEKGQKLG